MRVLIAILACHHREAQTELQRQTWGSRGPWPGECVIRVFRGHPVTPGKFAKNHGSDLILNVADTYEAMCAKARMVYNHAYLNGFDFLLTTGDDAWIHPPRLMTFCSSIWNQGKPTYDYVGHLRGADNQYDDDYASGGAGTLYSAKALKILALAPPTDDPAEDRWAGNTLRAAGILLHSDRQRFCLPAEWRDRMPWEPIVVETMRVHRGALASMQEIHEECYDAVADS